MHPRPLIATKLLDLRDAGVEGVIIDWSIDLDGVVTVLAAKQWPEYRRPDEDEGMRYHGFSRRTNEYMVHHLRDERPQRIELPGTCENFCAARFLPPDRFLLVRGRRRRAEPANGVVIDSRGHEIRRINLGDLVQHIFVAADASLWLGYGDEVYGDPLPAGGGVTHLDLQGEVLYALNRARGAMCMDCYAMTMNADGSVWAYIYTDFPLVRISAAHRSTIFQPCGVRGAKAVAVQRDHALLYGTYDDPTRLTLLDTHTNKTRRVEATTSRGRVIGAAEAIGVAGVMCLREKDTLFTVRLDGQPTLAPHA